MIQCIVLYCAARRNGQTTSHTFWHSRLSTLVCLCLQTCCHPIILSCWLLSTSLVPLLRRVFSQHAPLWWRIQLHQRCVWRVPCLDNSCQLDPGVYAGKRCCDSRVLTVLCYADQQTAREPGDGVSVVHSGLVSKCSSDARTSASLGATSYSATARLYRHKRKEPPQRLTTYSRYSSQILSGRATA